VLREHVQQFVGRRLRELGFMRKGTTYRCERAHGIEVFNLQGSRFGQGTFYLNVGVYLGGDVGEPREYDCRHRGRVEHEGKTEEQVLAAALASPTAPKPTAETAELRLEPGPPPEIDRRRAALRRCPPDPPRTLFPVGCPILRRRAT